MMDRSAAFSGASHGAAFLRLCMLGVRLLATAILRSLVYPSGVLVVCSVFLVFDFRVFVAVGYRCGRFPICVVQNGIQNIENKFF